MIIGITGTLGAGKGTVVEFLRERGFEHYCVTSFISEEVVRRGLILNRDNLVFVANDLRAKFGPGYIVEQLYKKAKEKGGDTIIESLRCPGEIEHLREVAGRRSALVGHDSGEPQVAGNGFVLWAVDADIENRYSRIVERGGVKDNVSFQDFVAGEQREMSSSDPAKQNLKVCIEMADCCFRNDWTKGELKGKVDRVLEGLKEPSAGVDKIEEVARGSNYIRPSWDEYFMDICKVVAKRGTCDRGRSGCVVVRDKQILVTGYVGSAKGSPHCDDVGHQIEATIHEDGVKRNHCVRTTHAEQNAICQAAKLGISIDGATLYCKMVPCPVCARMIVNSGVKRVVCEKLYQSGAQELMEGAGVKVEVLIHEVEKY